MPNADSQTTTPSTPTLPPNPVPVPDSNQDQPHQALAPNPLPLNRSSRQAEPPTTSQVEHPKSPLEAPTLQHLQTLVPLCRSDLPKPLPQDAGQQELWEALSDTQSMALEMADQIETLTAWCKLYASENAVLRNQLHGKKNKPKEHFLAGKARVLTKPEQMEEIRKKEEEVRKKAAAKEAKGKGSRSAKGKGKAAKAGRKAIWIDEEEDLEGNDDARVGREGDNVYAPSVGWRVVVTGSKTRPQRAKQIPLVQLQQNIEPVYGSTEATHQELATHSEAINKKSPNCAWR